jgi:hypothetical protein
VAFGFLLVVQVLLLVMIFYQRYILDRPGPYYNDLAILLGITTVGFWLVNLYLGGALPVLSFRRAALVYLLLVTSIALPYTMIRGLPQGKLWITWTLVILVGPGALVGGYSLAAYLGNKRLDHLTNLEN